MYINNKISKRAMEKGYLIALLVIVAIVSAGYLQQTGEVTRRTSSHIAPYTCTDSDGGFNFNISGYVYGNSGRWKKGAIQIQ